MTLSPDTTDHAAIVALVSELDIAASALDIDRFLDLYVDGRDFAFVFNGTMRTTLAEARAFHEAAWSNVSAVAFRTQVGWRVLQCHESTPALPVANPG